jgi:hypothetical protein
VAVSKFREILQELGLVLAGRSNLLDSIVPPALFLLLNVLLGFQWAMWGSLVVAVAITLLRLRRGQRVLYALGGIGGVALAIAVVWVTGRAEGYFLPGIVTGVFAVLVCLVSVLARRPIVAWTSYVTRRWPLDWYWHPKVRPAYSEVTWLWVFFFSLRLLLQVLFFQRAAAGFLAFLNVVTGWPATILLLVVSYLYGTWRLRVLGGPSVDEFKSGASPPWQGQRRGF